MQFVDEETQKVYKHLKRKSNSLVIRKMLIKAIMTYQFLESWIMQRADGDLRIKEPSCTAGWSAAWCICSGGNLEALSQLHICINSDPTFFTSM